MLMFSLPLILRTLFIPVHCVVDLSCLQFLHVSQLKVRDCALSVPFLVPEHKC